jgi:hypothetical protein
MHLEKWISDVDTLVKSNCELSWMTSRKILAVVYRRLINQPLVSFIASKGKPVDISERENQRFRHLKSYLGLDYEALWLILSPT